MTGVEASTVDLVNMTQFGFAAVMAVLIWRGFQDLVARLLTIIEQNSQAMHKFGTLLDLHTRSIDGLREAVGLLDHRMERVEDSRRTDRDRKEGESGG